MAELENRVTALKQLAMQAGHRRLLVMSGRPDWCRAEAGQVCGQFASDELLWVCDREVPWQSVSQKQAGKWLGREKLLLVFDATEQLDVDALGAVSGIIRAGGLMVLLLDAEPHQHPGMFYQRFLHATVSDPAVVFLRQGEAPGVIIPTQRQAEAVTEPDSPFITPDQQEAVAAIRRLVCTDSPPLVLTSDRGRGKSASLGIAAGQLLQQDCEQIIVTAPRYAACEKVFQHAQAVMGACDFHRGAISQGHRQLKFYPPDQLLEETPRADLLLVDEAAAIPVHMLMVMLSHYKRVVFATTVHGYEGTGRGFALRFNKILNQQTPGWQNMVMNTPVRWAAGDPLEQWISRALCLDADIADEKKLAGIKRESLSYREIVREDLLQNESLLREMFALLVLAHYRTRPSDLQHLMDDESLSLYVAMYQDSVVAVSLVSREGHFDPELASAVYRGERRPAGHLLAQTLTYHCGYEAAATLDVSRIMRIAVHPAVQSRGIGTQMLQVVIEHEKNRGRDLVGTSFSANTELLSFWQKAGLEVARVGFIREHTSGEHAAVMLKPLSSKGQQAFDYTRLRFIQQWPYWLKDSLRDIPEAIKETVNLPDTINETEMTETDWKDLDSYILYQRSYETCLAAIVKFVRQKIDDGTALRILSEHEIQVIRLKVIESRPWKQVAEEAGLAGKNDARTKVKTCVKKCFKA